MGSIYEMAITNLANYFRNGLPKGEKVEGYTKSQPVAFDVFEASSVLEVVFCKSKEETVLDIMKCQKY